MCRGITCIVLGVVNAALLLIGLAVMIFGALLKWNRPVLEKIISLAMKEIQNDVGDVSEEKLKSAIDYIQSLGGPVGLFIFIAGAVIACIAGLAFIGLCCHIRLFLIVYAAVIAAIFVVHGIILIIYFSNRDLLLKPMHTELEKLVLQYQSVASGDPASVALALIMPTFECCGYNNGDDFKQPESRFTKEDEIKGQKIDKLEFPVTCCKPEALGVDANQCPKKFTAENSYRDEGCKQHVDAKIDQIAKLSIIMLLVEAAVLALTILHLCCK